jgi:hemerythrin superfamily protein
MNKILSMASPSATNMIRLDHTHVMATFHQYKASNSSRVKQGLVNTICLALEVHAQLEEEIFYPALREVSDSEAIRKAVPEHNEMKRLISELRKMEPGDARYDETFMELMRDVIHHVADEETILLPEAERVLKDELGDLGARMTKRRMELAAPKAGAIAGNMARSMSASTLAMVAGVVAGGVWLGTHMMRDKRGAMHALKSLRPSGSSSSRHPVRLGRYSL